jgi:microcystin-dependent protein
MAFDLRILEYRIFSGSPVVGSFYTNNFFTFNLPTTDSLGTWAEYTKYFNNGIRFNLPEYVNSQSTVIWPFLSGYNVGDTGGLNETRIAESQLGPHDHQLISSQSGGSGGIRDAARNPPVGNSLFVAPNNNRSQRDEYNLYGVTTVADRGVSKKTGGYQGVENRPPYYALAFIMYVGTTTP